MDASSSAELLPRPPLAGSRLANRAQREAQLQNWLLKATESLTETLRWSAERGGDDGTTTCVLACGPRCVGQFKQAVSMFVRVEEADDRRGKQKGPVCTREAGSGDVAAQEKLTCYARSEDGCFVWYEPTKKARGGRALARGL